MAKVDLTGHRFGMLVAIEPDKTPTRKRNGLWLCRCDCGNKKSISKYALETGRTKSCGCLRMAVQLKKAKALVGKKIGLLRIKRIIGFKKIVRTRGSYNAILFEVRCDCGVSKSIIQEHLYKTRSCGCLAIRKACRGENAYHAKLTNSEAIAIRDIKKSGLYSIKSIAQIFKVSEHSVFKVISKKTYKDEKH